MPIKIKEEAKIKASKVYSLSPKDRKFVDKKFNKLYS